MKYLILFFFSILSLGQQKTKVDFIKCDASVFPDFDTKKIIGNCIYTFEVKSEIDTIKIDAVEMSFYSIVINGKKVSYKNNKNQLLLFSGYKKGKNTLSIGYSVKPKQTMYFTGTNENHQIWTQGQGKYTSHWLPSFDDVNEKLIFNLTVHCKSKFKAISNGVLLNVRFDSEFDISIYKFKMKKPMSSYLVMLAIGKFNHKNEKSNSGIPLENYYKPVDEAKYQFTYKHSKEIFNFLEKQIGVKYPWEIYRQIPVEDFLYAGMENTSSTIFAQDFVVDECGYNDRNYINVNAHELAHQWFGDMVTAKSGKHHWLQEGFATYYALLAERKLFGEDYFYNALYRSSLQLRQAAKTDTIPVMNEKASSLSFYQKGAWALHFMRESIGAKKFDKAVKNYLNKYKFKNVETDDFLAEIRKVADFDTKKFQKEWLEDYRFQTEQANALLMKSDFYRKLSEINSYKTKSYAEKETFFTEIIKSDAYFQLKKEIIYQIANVSFVEKKNLIDFAMQTNDVKVRQAVAETINPIPLSFKSTYETLLNDKSYDTKQVAFLTLWKNFPEDHNRYLEIAKDWIGKNDRDLRITYLTLYQLFKDADLNQKNIYWNELLDYTSPKYESSIRQNAIENAFLIQPKNETLLRNLVNTTVHHKWQITKFGRDKIRELINSQEYFTLFENMLSTLPEGEQFQLKRLLVK